MSDFDPRWEWATVRTWAGDEFHIKGRCNHLETVPVESGGETVAHLCQTCDQQLPAEWLPEDTPEPVSLDAKPVNPP